MPTSVRWKYVQPYGSLLIWLAFLAGTPPPIGAEERSCPVCNRASSETVSYPSKAGCTLVRGTTNALLGWTELIRQPALEVKRGGNLATGLAQGVGQGVKRTAVGIAEALTFWTPKMNHGYLHFAHDCPLCMKNKTSTDPSR